MATWLSWSVLPWTKVSHLVNKETVVLDLPVKQCKTKDNVSVNIDVALAFRIMGDEELDENPELVRKFEAKGA
jgi:regulator of protease activity HflC (stomatin/prohibitin superfamily)